MDQYMRWQIVGLGIAFVGFVVAAYSYRQRLFDYGLVGNSLVLAGTMLGLVFVLARRRSMR